MLISELAERTNLPVHTIRFYEKEGLIDERFFERGENRYRYYKSEAIDRVEMIKHGQAAGYTLSEVRELLEAWDIGKLTTDTQIGYLQEKVSEINSKIQELESIRKYLLNKLSVMRAELPESAPKSA